MPLPVGDRSDWKVSTCNIELSMHRYIKFVFWCSNFHLVVLFFLFWHLEQLNYKHKKMIHMRILWCKNAHFLHLKTGDLKTIQIWIQFFFNKKFWILWLFFTCILPDYMAHDIPKEFGKNIHFENMIAGFLLRCQNWLRWEMSLICHGNIDS